MNLFEKQKHIFASFFLLSNRLQVIGNSHLADGDITVKQWFLMLVISQSGEKPPMLTEVADLLGTSRQNVKQLALKLQEKGFLNIERDEDDSRALRLKLTNKNRWFWEERQERDETFIRSLFSTLTPEEVNFMYSGFNKLLHSIERLESK